MAKRDTDTEIWDEDWFIDLEGSNQLFWFYIKDRCDHAGLWRPNFKRFEQITGHRINQEKFLEKANSGKQRIMVLKCGKWFLVGYIAFHYSILNLKNRFHNSVYNTFIKNVSCENTMDYGFEVKLTSSCPQVEVNKEQRTENREQRIKNGEDGNRNEDENSIPEYLKITFEAFLEMRKSIKKPMTEHAKKLAVEKLETLYPKNQEMQIACLNQSIMNCWQGIFKIKEETQQQRRFGKREVTRQELIDQAERIHLE